MGNRITYDDYLKLLGLSVLAKEHKASLTTIEKSILTITSDYEDGNIPSGHTSDFVWGESTLDEYLERIHLEVEKAETPNPWEMVHANVVKLEKAKAFGEEGQAILHEINAYLGVMAKSKNVP